MLEEKDKKYEEVRLEPKDMLAIMIAVFQVLMPFVIIILGAFALVFVLLMKFWIRT